MVEVFLSPKNHEIESNKTRYNALLACCVLSRALEVAIKVATVKLCQLMSHLGVRIANFSSD